MPEADKTESARQLADLFEIGPVQIGAYRLSLAERALIARALRLFSTMKAETLRAER